MRISDWSSDVCSSDLVVDGLQHRAIDLARIGVEDRQLAGETSVELGHRRSRRLGDIGQGDAAPSPPGGEPARGGEERDRKSVVLGTGVSLRVALGGRRIIKKKTIQPTQVD